MADLLNALESTGEVTGRFDWAGHHDRDGDGTAGVLRWSAEEGASLQLIGPLAGWPGDFTSEAMTINGVTASGAQVTLLNAWISRMTMLPQAAMTLRSSTLVADAQLDGSETWRRAAYRTAHLHEWLPETGIGPHEYEHDDETERWQPTRLAISWQPPPSRAVAVPAGRLTLSPGMSSPSSFSPEVTISTWMSIYADPVAPSRIDELWRGFAAPMLALLTIATGRRDEVTFERLIDDTNNGRSARVLRQGAGVVPREWMRGRAFLFDARELPDIEAAIARWYALYEATFPALSIVAESLEHGSSYSGGRLVELFTAIEIYCRVCHPGPRRQVGWPDKLRRLADFADVPPELTGWTPKGLKLIHATRNYYVHPSSEPLYGFTVDEIQRELVHTTARATALMQGCLMRDLGLDAEQRRESIRRHYGGWLPQTAL